MTTDATQRQQSRERYEHVLETIRANTGRPDEPQRAGIHPRTVLLHCCAHGRFDVGEIERTIGVAKRRGDLVEYRGLDGEPCLARTTDEALAAVIERGDRVGVPSAPMRQQLAQRINSSTDT